MYDLVEIFESLRGEGRNTGRPCVFVRFAGCNLRCPWCDTDVSRRFSITLDELVREVAQYANEAGAIGYSFRYFVEELSQENDVRILAVDGILPTRENIENGTYPLTVDLCVVSRTGDPNPNVKKLIEFLLSDDGQEIIRRTGYGGLSR